MVAKKKARHLWKQSPGQLYNASLVIPEPESNVFLHKLMKENSDYLVASKFPCHCYNFYSLY